MFQKHKSIYVFVVLILWLFLSCGYFYPVVIFILWLFLSYRWIVYCVLINNIFYRIFLLIVTKNIYKLCWYKHISSLKKCWSPTHSLYATCYYQHIFQDFFVGSKKSAYELCSCEHISSLKKCW